MNKVLLDKIISPIYIADRNPSDFKFIMSLRKTKYNQQIACSLRESGTDKIIDVGFNGDGTIREWEILPHCGNNNGYISKVYDPSGNNNHVYMETNANQPRIVNSGVIDVDASGKPNIIFDGVNDLLVNPNVSISNLCSIFTVIKRIGSEGAIRYHIMGDSITLVTKQMIFPSFYTPFGGYSMGVRFPENFPCIHTYDEQPLQRILSYTRTSTTNQQSWDNGGNVVTNLNPTTTFESTIISLGGIPVGTPPGILGKSATSEIIITAPLANIARKFIEKDQGKYYRIVVSD